ncbi:MAG: hypothetical protein U0457_13040 [Candidatus Sericytochromatia bacterium]
MKKKAIFKYSHKDRLSFPLKQKIIISIFILLIIILKFINTPLSIFMLIFTFIYYLIIYPKRYLFLANRYFICGNSIIYYSNINKIVLNKSTGLLLLYNENNLLFKLEKDLFPTNARKMHKIENNKSNKFKKISEKIISKIKEFSPNVKMEGV